MALTDKDILITPNIGSASEPKIEFKGASASVGPSTITATIYPTNNGTLSFDGTEGNLFSIVNNLSTGSIFSVNPISGIPIIDVNADRTIALNPYGGNTGIGTTNPSQKLHVQGNVRITGGIYDSNNSVGTSGQVLKSTGTGITWVSGSGSGIDADTLDGLDSGSFLRSDANDDASGLYTFSNTTTGVKLDMSGHAGASNYNYFLRAQNDTGIKAVHFVNGSTRSADGGANTYTIRNDGGTLRLGSTSYNTLIEGSAIGINQSSPAYTLDVNGTIRAERYRGINSLTLASYQTINPASNVFLYSQPNDRDAWIFLDSADTGSNWGIYHRQIDSTVTNLPANSIGFIGGGASALQAYISLANGNGYFAGNLGVGYASPSYTLDVNGNSRIGRDLYISGNTGGNYGNRLVVGNTDTLYTAQDGNLRPTIQANGAYPVVSLNHTVTSNTSHGPTLQFTCNGVGNQFVIGSNGSGTFLSMGYSNAGDWNPHNGIAGYNGTSFFHAGIDGYIGLGAVGDWGPNGSGNPAYHLHFRGANNATNGHAALFDNQINGTYNGSGFLFRNLYGNHSWGIVSEYRVESNGGTDRPSILFSTGYNTDTWSVGFGGYQDSNFRINYDHGHRNSGWGTTALQITRTSDVTAFGSLRAPIFYDSDDTSYYVNPNSISRIRGLVIAGNSSSQSTLDQLGFWEVVGGVPNTTSTIGFKQVGGIWAEHGRTGLGYNTYFTMDTPGRGWIFRKGTVGGSDYTGTNVFSISNNDGETTIGSTWGTSNTFAALNVSQGQGSANTTYRDIDLRGSWASGEGHAITATHATTANNIVGQMVFEYNNPGSRIKWGRFYHSGDQSTYPLQLISDGAGAYLHLSQGATPTSVGALPGNTRIICDAHSGNNYFTFRNTSDNNTQSGLIFQDNNIGGYVIFNNYSAGSLSDSMIYGAYQDHIFQTGTSDTITGKTEVLRIKQNGDLHAGWFQNRFWGTYYDPNYYMGFTFGVNEKVLYIDNKSNDTRADIVFRTKEGSSPEERLRIRSTGNVGIGTTDPNTRLHIFSSETAANLLRINNGTQSLYLGVNNGAGGSYVFESGNNALRFGTNDTERLRISSGGNIGIGTTDPLQKLDVRGNFLLAVDGTTATHITQKPYTINGGTLSWEGSAGQLFSITNNLTSGSIFSVNDVSGIPSIDVDANGTIQLGPYGGNIGVGVTNPTQKLHVQGNVRITGALYDVNNAAGTSGQVLKSTGVGVTWVSGSGSGIDADLFDGVDSSTYSASLRANRNITGGGTVTVDASGNVLWSDRFIIISNGRGSNFSTIGYFDITCPTSGTITGVGGALNVTATAAGIPLGTWQALYYILPIGSNNASVAANFRVAYFNSDLDIPHNWVLICVRNSDGGNGSVYFNNGMVLANGESMNAIIQDNANTANTLVRRDASGNFSAGIITATSFVKSGGTSSQFLKADGSVDSTLYITPADITPNNTPFAIVQRNAFGGFSAGTITATLSGNATNVSGIVAVANGGTGATTRKAASSSIANFGQLEPHGTYTDANNVQQWGGTFIQGASNCPNFNGSAQHYQMMLSLGSNYDWGSGNVYAMQMCIARDVSTPYIGIRYKEGGNDTANWGSWQKIAAGTADTATNISNTGTVTLASATESNSIYITQPSYTTDQPVKLLNFDWYGNIWSLGNIRSGSTPSNGFGVYSSGTERARFTTSGLTVAGTVTANSDIKLKKNIKTIENALDKVLNLRGVEFDRIDIEAHQIGVIAQEVEKVIPEVVLDNAGTKSVAYGNLVSVLIEAVKEQQSQIEELKSMINSLLNTNN
jgi:hypothetical protein